MIPAPYTLTDLQQLSSDSAYYQQAFSSENIRIQAIKEAAQSLGMQAGLAAESQVIDQSLAQHEEQLSDVYNFRRLMYKDNILPPVIVQATNTVSIGSDNDELNIGGQVYKIIQQAKFVTTPPTWRDYLWMNYPEPQLPNAVLLPHNDQEQAIWTQTLSSAWDAGEQQAMTIYHINLHRMVRDFDGMLLYKSLLLQNMVSPYYMKKTTHGVVGNGTQMVIDQQNWQITQQPQLQIHSNYWQPVVVKGS